MMNQLLTFKIILAFLALSGCGQRPGTDAEQKNLYAALNPSDDAVLLSAMDFIQSGVFSNIHYVLIAQGGKIVFERYFSGEDENYGRKLGIVTHGAGTLHDIRSISKSVVSACIGMDV